MKTVEEILDYVTAKVIEMHKTCLTDKFDNGYFWAMKDLQSFIIMENSTDEMDKH